MSESTDKSGGQTTADKPAEKAAPKTVVAGADGSDALKVGDLKPKRGTRESPMQHTLAAFLPNRAVSPNAMRIIIAVEIAVALLIWLNSPFKVLPRPDEVLHALRDLWMREGLGPELMTSLKLNVEALAWSTLISLGLAY